MSLSRTHAFFVILASMLILPFLLIDNVKADSVPDWVKNIAKWYGNNEISENEFLNAIKFLIDGGIIEIQESEENIMDESPDTPKTAEIIMPNGNAEQSNTGFFIPLHLQVKVGTTVVWINDDNVLHTVQSQDLEGNPTGVFNSNVLNTGERFAFKFEDSGKYDYFCTLHPWRVGQVNVI